MQPLVIMTNEPPSAGTVAVGVSVTPTTATGPSAPSSAVSHSVSESCSPSTSASLSPTGYQSYSFQQWPQLGAANVPNASAFPSPNASASAHNLAMAGRTHPFVPTTSSQKMEADQSQSVGSTSSGAAGSTQATHVQPSQPPPPSQAPQSSATSGVGSDDVLDASTAELFQHAWDGLNSDKSASCHQCKTTKYMKHLVYCTRIGDATRKRRWSATPAQIKQVASDASRTRVSDSSD
jgi:hypothetical protein